MSPQLLLHTIAKRACSMAAYTLHTPQPGHWTYECKNEAKYQARPTRTQQLKNPKVR
jgi:hypothetical protein